MRAFINFVKDTLREMIFVFDSLTKYIANILLLLSPYLMLWIGVTYKGDSFIDFCQHNWFFLIVPIAIHILACFLKYYANVIGTGDICPVPVKRFTESDDKGMVSVDNSRVQEMLLYVADVEDYLERKGYL